MTAPAPGSSFSRPGAKGRPQKPLWKGNCVGDCQGTFCIKHGQERREMESPLSRPGSLRRWRCSGWALKPSNGSELEAPNGPMRLPGRLSQGSPVELAPRRGQRLGVRLRIAPVHPGCREQVKQEDEGVASLVTRPKVWPFLTALRGLPWGRGGVRAGALQLKFKCLSSRPALPLNEPHDLSKLKSLSSGFLVYTIGRMTVLIIIVRIK